MFVGKINGYFKQRGKQVTVITYSSLVKGIEDGTLDPKDYQLLILDEVHEALSGKRIDTVRHFDDSLVIGFTATPEYSADKSISTIVPTEIHRMSIREAASEGLIAPFSVIIAETNTNISEVKVTSTGEYSEKELEAALNVAGRNKAALELYKAMFNGKTAIVNCCGIDHAEKLAEMFNAEGIRASAISSRHPNEQERIIEDFHNGHITVLTNANLVTRGFNDKSASVIFNLRPTLSKVLAEQRGGRALRVNPNDSLKHSHIVDFLDQTGENARNMPISFADVVGDAIVGAVKTEVSRRKEEGDYPQKPSITIEGIKVTIDPKEVMKILNLRKLGMATPAPEGWMTVEEISRAMSRSRQYVALQLNKHMSGHQEWVSDYLDTGGSLRSHYHPDLIKSLKQNEKHQPRPEGWMTLNDIARAVGRSQKHLNSLLQIYVKGHSEWVAEYLKTGKVSIHYHPDLVRKVTEEAHRHQSAPEGWMTAEQASKMIGRSRPYILKQLNKHAKDHPEWTSEYIEIKGGVLCIHYHPDLVRKVTEEAHIHQLAPEGWKTITEIARVTGNRMAPSIKTYAKDHPEWASEYLDKGGNLQSHYHPDLVRKVTEEAEKHQTAPEGWMTAQQIVGKLGRSKLSLLNVHTKDHPEWTSEYLNKIGILRNYYHPDLVRILEQETEKHQPAPEGWMTRSSVAKELGKNKRDTGTLLRIHTAEHPEWVAEHVKKGKVSNHYHPDLVKKLKEELALKTFRR